MCARGQAASHARSSRRVLDGPDGDAACTAVDDFAVQRGAERAASPRARRWAVVPRRLRTIPVRVVRVHLLLASTLTAPTTPPFIMARPQACPDRPSPPSLRAHVAAGLGWPCLPVDPDRRAREQQSSVLPALSPRPAVLHNQGATMSCSCRENQDEDGQCVVQCRRASWSASDCSQYSV